MTCCANVNRVMKFKVMHVFRLRIDCASAALQLRSLRALCFSAAAAVVVLLSNLRFRAKEAIQAIEAIEAMTIF